MGQLIGCLITHRDGRIYVLSAAQVLTWPYICTIGRTSIGMAVYMYYRPHKLSDIVKNLNEICTHNCYFGLHLNDGQVIIWHAMAK